MLWDEILTGRGYLFSHHNSLTRFTSGEIEDLYRFLTKPESRILVNPDFAQLTHNLCQSVSAIFRQTHGKTIPEFISSLRKGCLGTADTMLAIQGITHVQSQLYQFLQLHEDEFPNYNIPIGFDFEGNFIRRLVSAS